MVEVNVREWLILTGKIVAIILWMIVIFTGIIFSLLCSTLGSPVVALSLAFLVLLIFSGGISLIATLMRS